MKKEGALMPHSMDSVPAHGLASTRERRGRPRKYANDSERSRAYRMRVKERKAALEAIAATAAAPVPVVSPDPERAAAAVEFLDSLLNGDEVKQRRAWEDLEEVLGENRSSYRKLFP
jgi:hypothetical protein